MSETSNEISSFSDVLKKSDLDPIFVDLASRFGLWTESVHNNPTRRPVFPRSLSNLTPGQLTDLYSAWTYEYGRIVELCGAIDGQEGLLKVKIKSAQASCRSRLRRENATVIKLTQSVLNDLADEDPSVIELTEKQSFLIVLSAQAKAAKEATEQYLTTLSREIAFRDAQMKARIY
ncbi:MAG: hypothetical protein ACKOW9_05110 [Candidatus Paceibacterota bacterium]